MASRKSMLSDFFPAPAGQEPGKNQNDDKKKKRRPRLQFDPLDDVIRDALDLLGKELNMSPGQVMNYGTLIALIKLLKDEPDTMERIQPIKSLRFSFGLEANDLLDEVTRMLNERDKKPTRNK